MRTVLFATLLFNISVLLAVSAEPAGLSHPFRLSFPCDEVAETASEYFKNHRVHAFEKRGMLTPEGTRYNSLSIHGAGKELGGVLEPWTDAQGNKISDFKVYWTYANTNDTEKLPFGVWHLRLGHYWPEGEMKLIPDDGGCTVNFQLYFAASGGNMIGILVVDSMWRYGSNGRMEREYMNGISGELEQRKLGPAKLPNPPQPELRF
jgi:hypothetical protein